MLAAGATLLAAGVIAKRPCCTKIWVEPKPDPQDQALSIAMKALRVENQPGVKRLV